MTQHDSRARQHVARRVWPVAAHQGELTAKCLVITFVPTTSRKLECREGAFRRSRMAADEMVRGRDRGVVFARIGQREVRGCRPAIMTGTNPPRSPSRRRGTSN